MHHAAAGAGILAIFGAFLFAIMAVVAAFWLIIAIAGWKILTKAGRPGWIALVPFYNLWTIMEVVGLPGPLGLIPLAPMVVGMLPFIGPLLSGVAMLGVIGAIGYMHYRLAKCFGKDQIFTVLFVLPTPLALICYFVLAFDSSEYKGAEAAN